MTYFFSNIFLIQKRNCTFVAKTTKQSIYHDYLFYDSTAVHRARCAVGGLALWFAGPGCQMLAYGYHQIICLSGSTSSAGRTMHTARQYTTGLMLAQERVFPTGGKYRSLLGDFSSRTNKLVLKIPNRPRCCTPLDSLPRLSAGAEHKQKRETNETEYQTNKT